MQNKLFIGVDVAKHWIDVAIHGGPSCRVANTEAAIAAWIGTLDRTRIGLIAFEPTGGYERTLQRALREAELPFARVHPNEVAAFRIRRRVKAKVAYPEAGIEGLTRISQSVRCIGAPNRQSSSATKPYGDAEEFPDADTV